MSATAEARRIVATALGLRFFSPEVGWARMTGPYLTGKGTGSEEPPEYGEPELTALNLAMEPYAYETVVRYGDKNPSVSMPEADWRVVWDEENGMSIEAWDPTGDLEQAVCLCATVGWELVGGILVKNGFPSCNSTCEAIGYVFTYHTVEAPAILTAAAKLATAKTQTSNEEGTQ